MKIHDDIRATCARAEARAQKVYEKKFAAEEARHGARLAELEKDRDAELQLARQTLDLLPKNGAPPSCETGEHIYAPDGACVAGDAAIEPEKLPDWLKAEPPPVAPGTIVEGRSARRGKGA